MLIEGHAPDLETGRRMAIPGKFLGLLYIALIGSALVATASAAPGSGSFMEETARGMGVAAAAMLAAQFITSGRFHTLSAGVGLDVVLGFHRFAAMMLLCFACLHVLAFAAPSLAHGPARMGSHLATLLSSPRMLTGVLAFAGIVAITIASIKRDLWIKYEAWRFTHGFGALSVLILAAHHVVSTGTASFAPLLWFYWIPFFALAGLAFAHIYVGRPFIARRASWRIKEIKALTPRLMEVTILQTGGTPASFRAGQFVWINFKPGLAQPFDNPFSIASAPEELPRMRFVIKAVGDLTRSLPSLPPCSPVSLDGPHGNLVADHRPAGSILLVAGGVGLAPLIGILRSLALRADKRRVRFIYAAGEPRNLVYADEMRALETRLNLVNYFTVDESAPGWTGRVGAIDAALIAQALADLDLQNTLALICGPTRMMAAVADMIADAGVPLDNIVYEKFAYD